MDAFEQYVLGQVLKDKHLVHEAIKDVPISKLIDFRFAYHRICSIAELHNLNAYTFLVHYRSLFVDGVDYDKLNKAVLLEYCIRYDQKQFTQANEVLQLGTPTIKNDLESFLKNCGSGSLLEYIGAAYGKEY